jgi:co-chaperonin GroES (HSP10)
MKIQPISNYLIIKLDPADENIGNSKLIAPGQLNEAYNVPKRMGTVRAVGRGLVTAGGEIIPPQLITVEYDGEDCLVLSDESHVIGIITEESSLILGGK